MQHAYYELYTMDNVVIQGAHGNNPGMSFWPVGFNLSVILSDFLKWNVN